MGHDESFVAVTLERCILSLSLLHQPMTLDQALGKGTAASSLPTLPPSLRPVNLLAVLADTEGAEGGSGKDGEEQKRLANQGVVAVGAGLQAVAQAVNEGNRREKAILDRLEQQSNDAAVSQVVCSYVEELQAEAEARDSLSRTTQQHQQHHTKQSKRAARKGLVSQTVVRWVVERAVQEESKGGLDLALMALVRGGSVSARREGGLVGYAIESGNLLLLEAMLGHASDVSEGDMVLCLKHVLVTCSKRSMDKFITAHAASEPNVQVMDYDTVRRHLLDLILVLPKDHWLLVASLRQLTLKEAERLLRYCHSLLKMFGVAPTAKIPRPKGSKLPSLSCIVDWTSAIMDAHFTALLLSPDTSTLLKELEQSAKAETKLAREIISLDGLLQHLVHRKPLPVRPIPKYSVDTLML